jgi:hypothetical protein
MSAALYVVLLDAFHGCPRILASVPCLPINFRLLSEQTKFPLHFGVIRSALAVTVID